MTTFAQRYRTSPIAGRIHRQTDLHGLQLSDAPVADELGSVSKLRRRALLTADLKDPPRPVDGIAQRPALRDVTRRYVGEEAKLQHDLEH